MSKLEKIILSPKKNIQAWSLQGFEDKRGYNFVFYYHLTAHPWALTPKKKFDIWHQKGDSEESFFKVLQWGKKHKSILTGHLLLVPWKILNANDAYKATCNSRPTQLGYKPCSVGSLTLIPLCFLIHGFKSHLQPPCCCVCETAHMKAVALAGQEQETADLRCGGSANWYQSGVL